MKSAHVRLGVFSKRYERGGRVTIAEDEHVLTLSLTR